MKTPIETMLDRVEWKATGAVDRESALPYATHEGVFTIGDASLRCYRLNTGEAVFNADDFREQFSGLLGLLESDGAA